MPKFGGRMHYFAFGHSSTHPKMAERKKNCFSPCWNFQTPTSKAPRHVKCKLFCIWPPTFNAKGWRPNTTKFASAPNWAYKLQVRKLHNMLNAIYFLCLTSNFWQVECKKIALSPLRAFELGAWKLEHMMNAWPLLKLNLFWSSQAWSLKVSREAKANYLASAELLCNLKNYKTSKL